ncbi:alpha/beta fold hydrolase [Halorarius litoreus]|uniref:alpha/beta fold hydrolase n=1 Tax=Halorarius litoreus TaxID=2962676 RepID=UPI0020CD49A1|nr:alpha/beta hydrolase [Halorarius litoreus]
MPAVETNGVETYYETDGDGPPVVLLHGAGMDGRLWAEQARPLADDHRLVVPDLRGHGRTGGSAREDYSVALFADDVRALVDALDLDRPAVVGHSMGAFVALVYAARHTDACAGLATLGGEVPEPLSYAERIESHRPALVDALAPVFGRERVKRLLRRVDAWRYDERGRGDPEAIERVHERHGDVVPEPSDAERRKLDAALATYYDVSVDYSRVAVPSLHLYGEYEIPMLRRHARFMADALPNGTAREIPDAGHVSMVDNPGFVVDALREWLGNL